MGYALEILNLKKKYSDNLLAVNNLSFKVNTGEIYAILGKNGCGKTTTINCILGLVKKTSGEIFIDKINIDKNPNLAKLNINVVPQEFNFNLWESVENILINQAGYFGFKKKEIEKRIDFLLKKLDLIDKKKIEMMKLSGGQKRRVMICRALITNPKILILDEPTAGVDIEIRQKIYKFLKYLNKVEKITIILTTHYLEEVELLCDKVLFIKDGKNVVEDKVKNIIKNQKTKTFIFDLNKNFKEKKIKKYKINSIKKNEIEIELKKNEELNNLILEFEKLGYKVLNMKNKKNRLEEFFLENG